MGFFSGVINFVKDVVDTVVDVVTDVAEEVISWIVPEPPAPPEFTENVQANSRLSCQIDYDESLDGLEVSLPESQY